MLLNEKQTYLISAIILGLLFGAAALFPDQVRGESTDTNVVKKGIIGVWELNKTLSEGEIERTGVDLTQFPTPFVFAPQNLILAGDERLKEITINEGFEKTVYTQTFPTDGREINDERRFSARAFWQNNRLIVEYKMPGPGKMIEIFELTKDQNQLKILLRIEDGAPAKALVIKRIYDRTADQPVTMTEAEINLAESPF